MVALLKLGHDLFGKQLQGLHNVLVLAVTALREEVQDVEVGGFVLAEILTDKFRRSDEHAAPAHAVQHARALVLRLQVRSGLTRLGGVFRIGALSELTVDVVPTVGIMTVHPPEHEAKKLRAGEALLDGFLIGPGAEHVATSNEARVDGSAERAATGTNEFPVARHPLLGILWRLEADTQGTDP